MSLRGFIVVFLGLVLVMANTFADTITLKDGHKIEGTFLGKDGDVINFESDGIEMAINASKIANLSMGAESDPVSKPPHKEQESPVADSPSHSEKPPKKPKPPRAPAIVPVGTVLTIRLNQQLSTTQQATGARFSARLDGGLTSNGRVVVPDGAEVIGVIQDAKQSGRVFGHSSLIITLSKIKVRGVLKPIATNSVNAATEATGRDSTGKVIRGAALGGLIDGGHGAETGAKVGVGLAILTKGNQVVIPAGSYLEFQLRTPLYP
jgi:hypothetical protein